MSETTTGTAGRPPRGGEPKVLGMPRTAVLVGSAVFIAAVVWFLVKRRQSAAPPATTGPGECTDASGNIVPCQETGAIDYSGQLSALQTEIESLLAAGGVPATGGGGGAGTGGGTGGGSGAGPGLGTGTSDGISGGAGAGAGSAVAAPPRAQIPPTPGGIRAVRVTSSSVTLAWSVSPGATGYVIRVTYQSQLVKQQSAGQATTATISGLGADHTYGMHVIATNSAGWSPEGSITVRTTR